MLVVLRQHCAEHVLGHPKVRQLSVARFAADQQIRELFAKEGGPQAQENWMQTARAIAAHRNGALEPLVEPLLVEQHFGAWQGLSHAELAARRDGAWHRFWLAPADEAPPGGESFVQVVERVGRAVRQLSETHAGRDIVAVAHGGTIRAALALALELEPERALALSVDNCSLTRLEHIAGPASSHAQAPDGAEVWRVVRVNQPPRPVG